MGLKGLIAISLGVATLVLLVRPASAKMASPQGSPWFRAIVTISPSEKIEGLSIQDASEYGDKIAVPIISYSGKTPLYIIAPTWEAIYAMPPTWWRPWIESATKFTKEKGESGLGKEKGASSSWGLGRRAKGHPDIEVSRWKRLEKSRSGSDSKMGRIAEVVENRCCRS